ncbi:putative biphenyl dioxygenase system ferredoxin component [Leptospira inadai serovar Lyme str. 10]|uniref:Benzene 1,2-dioxygenase n=2 Tax=Leptospira inadai serovar Lyme TaxID=293084 RepID=A0ABX4YHT4_9LEPT|nr:Rieske 2Fe-2S domain-containing protein [Leptospira inadai]EQA37934.1 putative biphenyl dioxygenase system ferredoxin component [Leptospira inadai serovar Lyme str. 10]PNV74715.1 benzene 1,2-dioxygenase [Leptospira inadai serovar Lyme]
MGTYRKLVKVSELKEGEIRVVATKYSRIGLTIIGGEICAFEDVCTHDGEAISHGELKGDVITCPRHFAKFNVRDGRALCMPAVENLPIFRTRIVDDEVEVELED